MEKNTTNKIEYKTVEELDIMSYDEIRIYHDLFITESNAFRDTECSDRTYSDELDFYIETRFKEEQIAMIKRWKEKEAGRFKTVSYENLYKTGLSSSLPKDGAFFFITPIQMPEGITINELIEFNKIFHK